MASVEKIFNIDKSQDVGSKLSQLTNPINRGKIKYIQNGANTLISPSDLANAAITGIVFPIGVGTTDPDPTNKESNTPATHGTGTPWYDPTEGAANNGFNVIGDPAERNYSLTDSDLRSTTDEKNGGAQKFINALLDSAYVSYNSGVNQGSGLNSMTVTRGSLNLNSSTTTGISGVVNTYSRSYTVSFTYKQQGHIGSDDGAGNHVATLPDIQNDIADDGSPF